MIIAATLLLLTAAVLIGAWIGHSLGYADGYLDRQHDDADG